MNPKAVNKEDMAACLPHLYAALEDRNAEVRKGAHDAVLPFMIQLGYESMARNAGKLKPASKTVVLAQLEKVRPNLPAKPVPAPAATPAPASATAVRGKATPQAPAKEVEEDDDAGKPVPGKVLRVPSKTKVKCPIDLTASM